MWPRSLVTRAPRPLLVYLDLNHWISLAKADTGHTSGIRYRPVLDACRQAVTDGVAIFPLAAAHYLEVSKIRSPRQRQDLAAVMEQLSDFWTLLCRPEVMRTEIDALVSTLLDHDVNPPPSLPLLGRGVFWAFGRVGMRVMEQGMDITNRFRVQNPRLFDQIFRTTERKMLAGHSDDELKKLGVRGWQPDATVQRLTKLAQQEQDLAHRLDVEDKWRRGRLRDVILARTLFFDLNDIYTEAMQARGAMVKSLLTDRERARCLVRSLPGSEVSTELKVAGHRNRQTKWTPNDIVDIEAMSLAVPYCDVVVTEKRACSTLRTAHLDKRMNARIIDQLDELPSVLRSHVSPRAATGPVD